MINAASEILYKRRVIIHGIRVHIRQLANPSQVEIGIDIESHSSPRRRDTHRNTTIDDQIPTSSSSIHLYLMPRI